MTYARTALPDPQIKPEFYADVATKRLLAWVVDTVLILAICLLIILMTAFIALIFLPFLYLVVGFFYRTLTLAGRSATPGMRLMAIEFRTLRGERLDPVLAALHTLGYTVSTAMVMPQIISILLMLNTARAQGLSDLVLGTVALNRAAGH
ncbi:MAG: RDD family protein [Rhodobacter sp.]|nr:RDD family protein [Rhodobacter sp.]